MIAEGICFIVLNDDSTRRMGPRVRGDDEMWVLVLATDFARVFQIARALFKQRAQGRPGARCTRGLVRNDAQKKCAHEHTGSAETLRPSLRNGFTVYFVLSLVAMLCHHRPRAALASRELNASIGASGPHDFAVRDSFIRLRLRA
jgi:hypothetical protein